MTAYRVAVLRHTTTGLFNIFFRPVLKITQIRAFEPEASKLAPLFEPPCSHSIYGCNQSWGPLQPSFTYRFLRLCTYYVLFLYVIMWLLCRSASASYIT